MPIRSGRHLHSPKALICFIGTLRSLATTAESIKTNLIEPLEADVAFCVSRTSSNDEENLGFFSSNKIVACSIYEDADAGYEHLCNTISRERFGAIEPFPWTRALSIQGNWLGGLKGIPGSGMHLNYNHYKLKGLLESPPIQDTQYSHFIITRTDFQWLAPHPPLKLMDDGIAWIPEGEDYQGYNDRHVVCSRQIVDRYLDFFESLISGEAYTYLHPYKALNHEYQLRLHLIHRGVRVGRFKNLAYLTGTAETQTNWSGMKTKIIDGSAYHCKYPAEVDSAVANSTALAIHENPQMLIRRPATLSSYLPIFKAHLRSRLATLSNAARLSGILAG